ncbi:hypothetical protein [Paenibacillus tianjinensis]|uniref:Uncharacterized protein n=1 Tax=Paenibacillus tianjinensis TaxID=2810347 RepID=A0ABX7L9P1_9BACL|nr:hypothetical protein [Paenibacillus tianjinensis]QSF43439.1 hypothetical protein JRJ22_19440 [Paenibacillus tianjinensis]
MGKYQESRIEAIESYYIYNKGIVDEETARDDIDFLLKQIFGLISSLSRIENRLSPFFECEKIIAESKVRVREK